MSRVSDLPCIQSCTYTPPEFFSLRHYFKSHRWSGLQVTFFLVAVILFQFLYTCPATCSRRSAMTYLICSILVLKRPFFLHRHHLIKLYISKWISFGIAQCSMESTSRVHSSYVQHLTGGTLRCYQVFSRRRTSSAVSIDSYMYRYCMHCVDFIAN